MVVLSMASMSNINECYDYSRRIIYQDKINHAINIAKSRYSPQIMKYLLQMIEFDINKRPDWI